MLSIQDHRLVGPGVTYHDTPNVGGALSARFLVMHYTAGSSVDSAVQSLCTRKPSGNASAHLVLGRDGQLVQLAPFNVVTWHAGLSQWQDCIGLNQYAIGLEMDNAGVLDEMGGRYYTWFRREVPASEVQHAAQGPGGPVRAWHAYTEAQVVRALEVAELLSQHYGLRDVLGHSDIAPGRKIDPGPAFPLAHVRARMLGREDDGLPRYVVTAPALNIRSSPDAASPPAGPALKKGTELLLQQAGSAWSRVEVAGPVDLAGWVNNRFIAPMPPAQLRSPRKAAAAAKARQRRP
jgi:N-acetylmuramoyl-L-alanine amidase